MSTANVALPSFSWEKDDGYCRNSVMKTVPYNAGPRLLDVMETAVFDYVIG